MLYRKLGRTGLDVSALGFGCMRLPLAGAGDDDGAVDRPLATEILRQAIDNGVNYVDTAYTYHKGNSETFLGEALGGGYRHKVHLATKLPGWLVKTRADMDRYLDEQLARLKTGHLDCYLVHAVNKRVWPHLVANGLFAFLDGSLADGRIRHAGFSFHDELPLFKEVVDAYPWSFCQIQYNYLDENYQAGREGLQYAAGRGLGVVVMEPLRGGRLAAADIPPAVRRIWDRAPIRRSPAEWALRFLWDQPEISVVLSGMNAMSQVEENIRVAGQAQPGCLTPAERALIDEVKAVYRQRMKIDCTGCRYCLPCPAGVDIPGCFALFNNAHILDDVATNRIFYKVHIGPAQKASNCTGCGRCEQACPQGLPIRPLLKETAQLFE